jgi:hypothetical protein
MVNNVFAKRPFPRLLLAAAAVLLTLVLGTCQFIGADMFPSYLTRAEAVLDLRSELEDAGVGGDFWIRKMEFLSSPSTGKSYIFVLVDAVSQGPRLIILDGETLGIKRIVSNSSIGAFLATDMYGYFISGNGSYVHRMDASTLADIDDQMTNPVFPDASGSYTLGSVTNVVFYDMLGALYKYEYTGVAFWNGGSSVNKNLDPIFYPDLGLRDVYCEGTKVRLLFSSWGTAFILNFSTPAAFTTAMTGTNVSDGAESQPFLPPSDDSESGWLTRDGAIVLNHDRDTRLTRYDADSGDELDYYVLDDTEETRIAFAPDGDRWLLFDGLSGKLHLLRTWW